jgi:uncharacterized membrane protein YgcG
MLNKIFILSILAFVLTAGIPVFANNENQNQTHNQQPNFIEFEKRFDDRAGILSESDLKAIENAAQKQEKELGLKAFVLIMPDIPDWEYDEFAAQQFVYWMSKGILDDKSYLFLVRINNRKFQVVRGDYISRQETSQDIRNLSGRLWSDFNDKNYGKGIVNYIEGLGEMPSLKKAIDSEKKTRIKAMGLALVGLLILALVFMRMSHQRQVKARKEEEERHRKGMFIE